MTMARPLLLACLAGALLLGGCADSDRYYGDRAYSDGGYRPYLGSAWGAPWGYYGGPPYYAYGVPPYYAYGRDRDDRVSRNGRFVEPDRHVVCDQRTGLCYKKGDLDKSETKDYFGKDAARRVEQLRDRYHDNDVFLPKPNVVCREDDRTCFHNGRPNRQDSRRYFNGYGNWGNQRLGG
jgi:hypothetical protein